MTGLFNVMPGWIQSSVLPDVMVRGMSQEGLAAMERLYTQCAFVGGRLLFVIFLIGCIAYQFQILSLAQIALADFFKGLVAGVFGLAFLPLIFAIVINTGYAVANLSIPDEEITQAAQEASRNINRPNPTATPAPGATPPGIPGVGGNGTPPTEDQGFSLSSLLSDLSDLGTSVAQITIAGMVGVLARVAFAIAQIVIELFWWIGLLGLLLLGPFVIPFAVLPGVGKKILANYFGLLVQFSALQVWLKLCEWMVLVNYSQPVSTIGGIMNNVLSLVDGRPTTGPIDAAAQLAYAGQAIGAVFLYIAGFKIIRIMLPLGDINSFVSGFQSWGKSAYFAGLGFLSGRRSPRGELTEGQTAGRDRRWYSDGGAMQRKSKRYYPAQDAGAEEGAAKKKRWYGDNNSHTDDDEDTQVSSR